MLNLIEAAERGDEDTVAEIVSNYEASQLSKKLGEIRTPLNRAAGYGQLATIEQLVKVSWNHIRKLVIFRPYLNMEGKSSTQCVSFFEVT